MTLFYRNSSLLEYEWYVAPSWVLLMDYPNLVRTVRAQKGWNLDSDIPLDMIAPNNQIYNIGIGEWPTCKLGPRLS